MINITQLHKINEEREKFKLKVYESVLKNVTKELSSYLNYLNLIVFVSMLFLTFYMEFLFMILMLVLYM